MGSSTATGVAWVRLIADASLGLAMRLVSCRLHPCLTKAACDKRIIFQIGTRPEIKLLAQHERMQACLLTSNEHVTRIALSSFDHPHKVRWVWKRMVMMSVVCTRFVFMSACVATGSVCVYSYIAWLKWLLLVTSCKSNRLSTNGFRARPLTLKVAMQLI